MSEIKQQPSRLVRFYGAVSTPPNEYVLYVSESSIRELYRAIDRRARAVPQLRRLMRHIEFPDQAPKRSVPVKRVKR